MQNRFIFNGKVISLFHLEAIWVEALTNVIIQVGGVQFRQNFPDNSQATKFVNEILEL